MADDLIGQRIGMLTVLSETEAGVDARGHPLRRFICRCNCGTEKTVLYNNLKTYRPLSCGCTHFKRNPPVDLTGQRFGSLTVISETTPYYPKKNYRKRRWLCKCDCGRETIVLHSNLTPDHGTRSCGCKSKATRRNQYLSHSQGTVMENWLLSAPLIRKRQSSAAFASSGNANAIAETQRSSRKTT